MGYVVKGQVPVLPVDQLIVATDGSVRKKREKRMVHTGIGWLSNHGHYGSGWKVSRTASLGDIPLIAELNAVYYATYDWLEVAKISVLTDSTRAVNLVNAWKAGDLIMPPGYTVAGGIPKLLALARRIARCSDNITIAWVPSHSGHTLNEGADALAKLGSRRKLDEITDADRRAKEIAEAFLKEMEYHHNELRVFDYKQREWT